MITGTLSITNSAALTNATGGQSFSLNGDTRTFTNSVASAASQIRVRTNDSAATILLSLVAQAGSYPFTDIKSLTTSAGTNVTFRATNGVALTITLSPTNWGTVTYSTQTVGAVQTLVRVPISAEDSGVRASIVEQLLQGWNDYSTSRALTNWVLNGPTFTNLGRAEFGGRVELDAGFGLHGRYLVATNYTLTTNDLYLGADTHSNTNLIFTLPSAASASNLLFVIKDEGGAGATNTLKIYPAAGDRIDTLLTNLVVSNNYGGVQLRSRGGTNWAILASGGGVTGGISSSGGNVYLTNSVWVAKNGSDGTGARGDATKAFLTLTAAKTAATSGDTIFVFPGTYNEANLLKDGVNWHFFSGAKVTYTGAGSLSIFDDADNPIVSSITGDGEFTWSGSGGQSVVYVGSDSGDVRIHAKSISASNSDYPVYALGKLTIEDCTITAPTGTPVSILGSSATTLNRCRVVMSGTTDNGAAIVFSNSNNTNSLLRDCVLIGNAAASSPVAMKAGTPATLRIDGGLMANLAIDSSVTIVTSEDRWYAGGVPRNDVVYHPTNSAPFTIVATDFALDTNYTNGTQRAHVSASLLLSANAADTAQVALYLDQDADTTFEQTGITASLNGLATNSVPLGAWVQPGAVFAFTNLSTGSATAAVNAGGSQWVKQ